jgi:hypothetical protein
VTTHQHVVSNQTQAEKATIDESIGRGVWWQLGCVHIANHRLIGVESRATSSPSATAHSWTRCGPRPSAPLLGITLLLRLVAQSIEVRVRLATRTFAATAA